MSKSCVRACRPIRNAEFGMMISDALDKNHTFEASTRPVTASRILTRWIKCALLMRPSVRTSCRFPAKRKNTAHSGIHRRTFGRFKNVIFIQRVKIIDIQVFALLLFDRRTTEQILRRRPGRSRPGSQFGIVASLTLLAMLCASLRLHPPSSPTGGGGLRRCSG